MRGTRVLDKDTERNTMRRETAAANHHDDEPANEPMSTGAGQPTTPAAVPRGNAPVQGKLIASNEQIAGQIRESAGAAFLYGSMAGLFENVGTAAFKIFRDRLLADAGNPTDPIEVMMIEQIVLAHMNIGRLQFKSASTDSLEAAKVYGGLSIQLLGEFRRNCLALQAMRFAARTATGAVIDQPTTVATGPDASPEAVPAAETNPAGAKLINKEASQHDNGTIPFQAEESEASRGGSAEPGAAARAIA